MNKYMKIAKELAEENLKTNVGGPFGACIVKDGKIIGKGSPLPQTDCSRGILFLL